MLKTLIKAQILQLLVMMTSSGSKNKKRNSTQKKIVRNAIVIISIILIIVVATVGLLAFAFCDVIVGHNVDWAYFSLFAVLSFSVAAGMNVFISCSTIYSSKDNNMLLSMPISPATLLISRMSVLVFNCILFSLGLWFPAVIVYMVRSFNVSILIGSLLMSLIITLAVLLFSIILGWIISLIIQGRKAKALLTILVTIVLVFVGIILNIFTKQLAANAVSDIAGFSEGLEKSIGPIAELCKLIVGDWFLLILPLLILLLCICVVLYIVQKSYFKIMTRTSRAKKKKYVAKESKARNISQALLFKERKRFFSMPIYLVNAGLGVMFAGCITILSIVLAVFGNSILGMPVSQVIAELASVFNISSVFICVLIIGLFSLLAGFNAVSTPSVSVEGGTLWVIKSMPVNAKSILRSKELFHINVNIVGVWLPCLISLIALGFNPLDYVLIMVALALLIMVEARFGLIMSVRFAKLEWTNPAVPVKQSIGVLFSILLAMFLTAIFVLSFYLFMSASVVLVSFIFSVCLVLLYSILGFTLNHYAVPAFKRL